MRLLQTERSPPVAGRGAFRVLRLSPCPATRMADPSDLSEPDLPASPLDRRATPRYQCTLAATCAGPPSAACSSCSAAVRDISAAGIGLVTSQRLPSGTVLTIELREQDQVILSRPLRIKHVRQEGPATWFLGGSFLTRLTKKEMKLFL